MNVGEEKEMKKIQMVNTSNIKYVVNAIVAADYKYGFHKIYLNHLLTNL